MTPSQDPDIKLGIEAIPPAPKTSVTPPQRYADAALNYFNEREVKLTSRQVVVYYLDAIMDLRTRDFSFARISTWIESECGVKVSSGFLHRVLTPMSEEDPRPKLLVELEVRRKQLEAARKYEAELADLKPGRPRKTIAPSPAQPGVSATDSVRPRNTGGSFAPRTTAPAAPPADSIVEVESNSPLVISKLAETIARADARKAARLLQSNTK